MKCKVEHAQALEAKLHAQWLPADWLPSRALGGLFNCTRDEAQAMIKGPHVQQFACQLRPILHSFQILERHVQCPLQHSKPGLQHTPSYFPHRPDIRAAVCRLCHPKPSPRCVTPVAACHQIKAECVCFSHPWHESCCACSHLDPALAAVRACCQAIPVGEVSCTLTALRLISGLIKAPEAGLKSARGQRAQQPAAVGVPSLKLACQFGLVWGVAANAGASDRAAYGHGFVWLQGLTLTSSVGFIRVVMQA